MNYIAGESVVSFWGINILDESSSFKDWSNFYDITAEMGTRLIKKGKLI
ncbi:hypothetical protein PS043_07070 [Escherichia albertii]|nr:hypothetical protein [Escherichia albertii]WDC31120.1 hypothetical protein PS043_07070 [Escherichia albertii]